MKQTLTSILFISIFSIAVQGQTANADLLRQLLDLPSPPPKNRVAEDEYKKKNRPKEFYSDKNVPKDNASINDLVDYWKNKSSRYNYESQTSEKVALRLLEDHFDKKPKELIEYFKVLPKTEEVAEKIKDIFDLSKSAEGIDEKWRKDVREWLKFNSRFYLDELISEAEKARDHKSYGSVIKEKELKTLAKFEWKLAETILKNLENDSVNIRTSTLAKTMLYQKAIEDKKTSTIEKYRKRLKEILTDRNVVGYARELASDALFSSDWDGQEDLYLSLVKDETLLFISDGSTLYSPLETLPEKNPDKWIPILAKLVQSENKTVRNAAAQSLIELKRKDSLIPLLPWLSNPDWIEIRWSPGGRTTLMQVVSNFDIPEAVPGLIWIVENEDEDLHWAARSLAKFKDSRAVPALKRALQRIKEEEYRQKIINALIASNGLNDNEKLVALEKYAKKTSTPEGFTEVNKYGVEDDKPLPVQVSIGRFLANQKEPNDEFIRLVIERQKVLKKKNPTVAKIFSDILQRWKGRLVDLELLSQIENGTADVETVVGALARRKELRKNVLNDIFAMIGKNGLANGVSACLSENETDLLSVLGSNDLESIVSVLACSRLIRAKLPVDEVGKMLNSENKLLALAAERYLISEDSPEARRLVYQKYPNKALILGARLSFNPTNHPDDFRASSALEKLFSSVNRVFSSQSDFKELDKQEKKLRQEILENPNLLKIYAHLPDNETGQRIVRVYKTHATFKYIKDKARYSERKITNKELEKFENALVKIDFENFRPTFGRCHYDCYSREFLALNKNGGRRIYSGSGLFSLAGLDFIETYFNTEKSETKFYFEKNLKGLEKVYSNPKYSLKAIWKNSNDFRVLVEDTEKEEIIRKELQELDKIDDKNEDLGYEEEQKRSFERRAARAFEHFEWKEFENGKLDKAVSEPDEVPYLHYNLTFPSNQHLANNDSIFLSKAGNFEIKVKRHFKYSLWKANRENEVKIKEGWFKYPITTVDGKWVVVSKTDSNWERPNHLLRINLQTGKEYKVNLEPAIDLKAIAFIPYHNKILVEKDDDFYLLEAKTGKVQRVKGEFFPWKQITFRFFQSTGKANEYWVAIPFKDRTEIGRYNIKDFSFKTVLKIPQITLSTMDIWIDEKEAKVFFVYNGSWGDESYLLSLPLPKE